MILADIRFPLERANGVQTVKTAAALARGGARVELVVRASDPRATTEILARYGVAAPETLAVRRLSVLHRQGLFQLPRLVFLVRAALAGRAHVRRGGVVFTRDLQLADLLLRLGLRALVYEAHAVEAMMYEERALLYGTAEPADPRKRQRIAAREGRVWRGAAAVVTTTNGIRQSLSESYGARERARVVPNGCDVSPGEWSAPPVNGAPRVVYAGQLYPWKGVDVLVEAMAAVPEARLVIAGGMPGERDLERLRALVSERGLRERTEMLGTVSQARVAEELQKASVVVVPFLRTAMTERHTSPLKVFEAMAAGRPIVASDLPSSREVLRHGETALLVPPDDAAALAAALTRLLADHALAERLARGAFAEAPRFSWDARAQALLALLAEAA
jgi:glycosyltransferase involved in cell wall biosynthesis